MGKKGALQPYTVTIERAFASKHLLGISRSDYPNRPEI
jgi:hypothetical protein